MHITILCNDDKHPVNEYILKWMDRAHPSLSVELVRRKKDAQGGHILFLVSCSEVVTKRERARYGACLVLHASDLPEGRGWSPHIWQLSQGAEYLTLSLLEAEDTLDSGAIWKKTRIDIPKHSLWDEINDLLFKAEIDLIDFAIDNFGIVEPKNQIDTSQSQPLRKRTPSDSEIDPSKTISEQFDLIRVCDPNRFPAYFHHLGQRYKIKLEKIDDQ